MDWKIKLANIGFTILQDDKPQLYFRQSDVEKFIEKNFVQQQVSVGPEVKPDFCGTYIVHLIERQLQGHSNSLWETIEAFENEDMAIDKKRMLNRRDVAYAHRVTSIKLTDKLSKIRFNSLIIR